MRILFVITTVDPKSGGPTEGVRQITPPLLKMGHEVEVVCADPPDSDWFGNFPTKLYVKGPFKSAYAYAPELRKWLYENVQNYDVIVARGIWQHQNVLVRSAAMRAKKPYWVFTHGMLDPWHNKAFPLKHLKKSIYWPWQYVVLRDAEAVLFTCEEEKVLARQGFKPYKVKEQVVNYGTGGPPPHEDRQRAAFRAAFPQLSGKRFLLYLGRINPKKGADLLFNAWPKIRETDPDLQVAMAGPCDFPQYKEQLDRIIDQHKIGPQIHWLGMVQGDVKWGAFRESEAFVLPSHSENFGIAVAESLACARPVLITHPVNIWREIEQDRAGIVVEDNLTGIESLLTQWVKMTPAEKQKMGSAALRCFQERFAIEKSAESLIRVLEPGLAAYNKRMGIGK